MPPPYSSYITAVQGIYNEVLTAALFPGGVKPALALDEIHTTGSGGTRQSPPYVLMFDSGSEAQWTFKGHPRTGPSPGHDAIIRGEFRFEAYALDLGDCDRIIDTILWNGQPPRLRAGVAFTSIQLIIPHKGVEEWIIPTRNQRQYSGLQFENQRVHVSRQWFKVTTAISGDGV